MVIRVWRCPKILKISSLKLLAGAVLLATGLQAHPKLAPELETLSPSAKVNVIVRYKQTEPTTILGRLPLLGGVLTQTLKLVDSLLMTLTGNADCHTGQRSERRVHFS